ncbi:MAG: glutamate-semialdehyde -aminomutase [Mycobacterium sp.]|jgi:hypothetical protein|nr:glutamate-semialdehyde -aminomutase [Mycobacterium sp.]
MLAEKLVDAVEHADWAMFAKNGSDVTTLCLTIARAHTGRATILVADGAYHGALPWCNPDATGVLPSDRAGLAYYAYNDLASVERLVAERAGDLAGIIATPFRHDAGLDQEMVDPAFAQGLRRICDENDAVLILDEVRTGFRMSLGGSWEQHAVRPDLSSWSKAIGNGYPIAAVLGAEHLREAAGSFFVTGTFWFSAVPMVAAWESIALLEEHDGVAHMFARGVFVHPKHNWFMSTALTEADVDIVLEATDAAFGEVAKAPLSQRPSRCASAAPSRCPDNHADSMRGAPDGHHESPHNPSGRPAWVIKPKALSPWVPTGFANVQPWAYVHSGAAATFSTRRSASRTGATASSGLSRWVRARCAVVWATSTAAPSPRRDPSSATIVRSASSLTNAASWIGQHRCAHAATTAITGS